MTSAITHTRAGRRILLAIAGLLLGSVTSVHGADAATVYRVRVADQRPPCAAAQPGLPIVPNDPGALTLAGGKRHCYGTRPPEMELWLPDGRYLWLASQAPNPAAWIEIGPVLVDPATVTPPPLGLRVTGDAAGLTLETRFGAQAILTPIEPDRWQPVDSADGRPLWVRVETGGDRTQPRVR